MTEIEKAVLSSAYIPLPETGPYLSYARFDAPKDTTKFFCSQAAALLDPNRSYTWADIGCANGEMIHHFKKHMPNVDFTGFDNVPAYIESANAHPTLSKDRARFDCKALQDVEGQFDVVSYFGIITTYWDWRAPFAKLLSLCRPGGYILVDGFFSPDLVETFVAYRDHSTAPDRMRRDWCVVPQALIKDFFGRQCDGVMFYDVPMTVDLPRKPAAPDINAWTFKDGEGKNRLTNGTRVLLDDVLMIAKKVR